MNLAFRREVLRRVGGFDTRLGPAAQKHLGYEDTAFVRAAQAQGCRVFYDPTVIVDHHIDAPRVTWPAIRKQGFESGVSAYRERWAARVGESCPRKAAVTLLFGLEYAYSCLRILLFTFRPKRRTVARFRAAAASGKIAGVWLRQ